MSQEEHHPHQPPPPLPPIPRDGPATVFEADPKVTDIFLGCNDGEYFGLVLVAGWPPDPSFHQPYLKFLNLVRECFDEDDWKEKMTMTTKTKTSMSKLPAVYLYPTMHIHVTIATFAPTERQQGSDKNADADVEHLQFQQTYLSIVNEASRRPDWPKEPIQLAIRSTQLGSKAGILLWDDTSGGISKMRQCIKQVAAGRNIDIWGIPDIIHSTFLRFAKVPHTIGHLVQERYQSKVTPQVQNIFQQSLPVKVCKLVIESSPYMHVPDDDNHVLHSWSLLHNESS
jgi:hypothetical protein